MLPTAASTPTVAGPATSDSWLASSRTEFARMSPAAGNRSFTTTASAVWEKTEHAPDANAMASASHTVSWPAVANPKSAANSPARSASVSRRTRHGSVRSTSTPAGRPTTR
jgi:hypothetical protein